VVRGSARQAAEQKPFASGSLWRGESRSLRHDSEGKRAAPTGGLGGEGGSAERLGAVAGGGLPPGRRHGVPPRH